MAGDRNESFERLELAATIDRSDLPLFHAAPMLDNLRGDPRFEQLARRVGVPPGDRGNASAQGAR